MCSTVSPHLKTLLKPRQATAPKHVQSLGLRFPQQNDLNVCVMSVDNQGTVCWCVLVFVSLDWRAF
jgi:hypothetical protein